MFRIEAGKTDRYCDGVRRRPGSPRVARFNLGDSLRRIQSDAADEQRWQWRATRPVEPVNIHATIYRALGIDPSLQILDLAGRPNSVLDDPTPIEELL